MGFNAYLRNEITRDISDVPDLNKETPALPSNREEDDGLELAMEAGQLMKVPFL